MIAIPLLLPGLLLAIVLAIVMARLVARWLGVKPPVAALLIAGFGFIVAATLTPTATALLEGVPSSGICDFSRVGIAPFGELIRPSESSLNILLFVPLGIAVGLLPRTRRSGLVAMAAMLLTFVVEGIQLLAPVLGRGCQSADLVDNLLGLVIGTAIGILLRPTGRLDDERTSGN